MKRITTTAISMGALVMPMLLLAVPPAASAQQAPPMLTAIRAAAHPGYDRVVFDFSGAIPTRLNVRYVPRLIADPSGNPISITGRAILEVGLDPATAHDSHGSATAPRRLTFTLKNVKSVVQAGDFESVVSYGIGLAWGAPFNVGTLPNPSRVIIDVSTRPPSGRAIRASKNIGTSGWTVTSVANPILDAPAGFTGLAVVQSRNGTKTWNQTEVEVQQLVDGVWRGLTWTHWINPDRGKANWSARSNSPTPNVYPFVKSLFPGTQFRTWAWGYVMAPDHKWHAAAVLSPVYTMP